MTIAMVPPHALAAEPVAASESSFLLFPTAQVNQRFATNQSSDTGERGRLIGDVLYTLNRGRFRLLAEVDVSNEYAELDRFQLGWEALPEAYVWFGKFHVPSSSWNFERDHGHYLQTAISIPAIETPAPERWGEDAGVLPENVAGILWDSTHKAGDSAAVEISLSLGVTPNPVENGDGGYWIGPISRGDHPIGADARLALLPDDSRNDSLGLLASEHEIDTAVLATQGLLDAGTVREIVFGGYVDGDRGPWSLHAAIYHIDFSLRGSAVRPTQSLIAGYAQLERRFAAPFTAFTRLESSSGAREDDYIRVLLSQFEVRRAVAGLRWDFAHHQAFTVELAQAATLSDRFYRISMQWSALIR